MHMLLDGQSGRAGPPSISHMRPSAQRELSGRCRVDTHAESVRGRSHEMSIVEITAFYCRAAPSPGVRGWPAARAIRSTRRGLVLPSELPALSTAPRGSRP